MCLDASSASMEYGWPTEKFCKPHFYLFQKKKIETKITVDFLIDEWIIWYPLTYELPHVHKEVLSKDEKGCKRKKKKEKTINK